eukprot:GEMP01000090.1.p1 GENE.GEMP01000090.1~~GEMP01000090.1.p1  ORF type:complete len:2784 (+),score=392.64 GEMP01000090.1:1465-9816(+)
MLKLVATQTETILVNATDVLASLVRSNLDDMRNMEQGPEFPVPPHTPNSTLLSDISTVHPGGNLSYVVNRTVLPRAPRIVRNTNIRNSNSSTIGSTSSNHDSQVVDKKSVDTTTSTTATTVYSMLGMPVSLTTPLHDLNTNSLDQDLKQLAQLLMNSSSEFYLPDLLANLTVTHNDTRDHIVFTDEDMASMRAWLPWDEVAASPLQWRFLGAQWNVTWNIASITIHHLSRSRIELWQGSDRHVRSHKIHVAKPVTFGVELRAKAMSEGGLFDGSLPALSIPEHAIRLNLEVGDINLRLRTFVYANEIRMRTALANYDTRCVAKAITQFITTFTDDMRWNLSSISASVTDDSDDSEDSSVTWREQVLKNFITSALKTNLTRAVVEFFLAQAARSYAPQWTEEMLSKARETIAQSQHDTVMQESCTPTGSTPDDEGTTEGEQEQNQRQAEAEGMDKDRVALNDDGAEYNIIPIFCELWADKCAADGRQVLVLFENLPFQIALHDATVHSNTLQTIDGNVASFSNIDLQIHFSLSLLPLPISVHLDSVRAPILADIKSPSSPSPHSRDHMFACEGWASVSTARLTWLPCYGVLRAVQRVVPLLQDPMNNTQDEGRIVLSNLTSIIIKVLSLSGDAGTVFDNLLRSKSFNGPGGSLVEFTELVMGSFELINMTVWKIQVNHTRIKVSWNVQLSTCSQCAPRVIDVVLKEVAIVAEFQLLTEFPWADTRLYQTITCLAAELRLSGRVKDLQLHVQAAFLNATIDGKPSLNWIVPVDVVKKSSQLAAEVLKRWAPIQLPLDKKCKPDSIQRASPSQKWEPHLHSVPPLPSAHQTALDAVVHAGTIALTKDMLKLVAVTVTEMVNAGMHRDFVFSLLRAVLSSTTYDSKDFNEDVVDDFNIVLRIDGVDIATRSLPDLFSDVQISLLNNSRAEVYIVTNDLSVTNKLTIELSLVFPETRRPRNWPLKFHLSTVITKVQLHAILTPSNETDIEVLERAPWCVLDNALLDLFAFEINIGALCVSGTTSCQGGGPELSLNETQYLKTILAAFIQEALYQRPVKLESLCGAHNDTDQWSKKSNGDNTNNINVKEVLVPLLNLTQLAKEAKYLLAPMGTKFFNNELQSWMPHEIPVVASMLPARSWLNNTILLRNWTVTVRDLTNVTFHDDGAIINAPSNDANHDDGGDNDGVLTVDLTIDAIELEVAVEIVFLPHNEPQRVWNVMTRTHMHGIQTTVAMRPFVAKSALGIIKSDWFTHDWGCLLHKVRPSFAFNRIQIYGITSTVFHTTINTREAHSIALPTSGVAVVRFFAGRLVGYRANVDDWFNNIQCTDPPISHNATSKRYQMAPAKESKLRDFEPTAQLAMRAMNALVFNRAFFQSFLSECVQWFKIKGGPNRIDGTDDLFGNGAGLVDIQIVDGRFEVVVGTPRQRPITITINDTVSAFRAEIEKIIPEHLDIMHNIVGSRIVQLRAIVDHIQFQLLLGITEDASKFLGKPAAWWASGCALRHVDIDLVVLELHLNRFCFALPCTTDIAPHEAALLRKAMATLLHATLKKVFSQTLRSTCVDIFEKYQVNTKENPRDTEKHPLPPQRTHKEWERSVRWGKNDLLRVVHTAIERSNSYLRTAHVDSDEDVKGIMSINGMAEFLYRQGRIIPLHTKVSMDTARDGVIVEVGNLVIYAPQKETLTLSGCTIMNLTTNAERDALVARINDTSWQLSPDFTDDILGLPTDATLLQIREHSTNRWHHRRANASVQQLLRGITIDGATTLTFAHSANALLHYTSKDKTLFSGRLDHVAVKGSVRALTGPLVAMAEDVILQEDDSRTVVRAYVASVLEHEWRNIWSTEITGNGWVNVTFDMDAYVVSDARAPDMNGIYSRLHVDGNEALYTNGKFRLQWNSSAAIWELRSVEDNDGDDIIVRSLTANAEGEWEGLRLIMRKVSNATRVPSAKLTLLHDNAIYPQRISSNGPVVGMHFDVSVDDSCHRVRLINLTNKDSPKPELERKSSFACTGTAQLKIKITSNNTLLVIRSSAPTIRFDVLNAEDVALGAKIGLSDATFSLQGAASILPKSPPAWHHFHVELEVYDFNAEVLMLARTLDGFFDIPKLLLTGLTSCHMQSLSRETLIKKLSVSSRLASVCFLSSAPNATASPEMVTVSFDRDGLDNMLLRDLSTSLLSAFVVPFVNKAIAPVKESSSCDESEGGKNGTWIEFVLITYIAFALGCVSAGIGFAYDCWRDGGCSPRARRRRASTEVNVFDSNGPLAFHPVVPIGMRFAVPLFIVAILFGLLVPVFFPSVDEMSTFQVRDKEYGFVNTATILLKQHSLWGTIADMYASQAFALFMVVLLLSGVLPYIKCLLILLAWCAPSHVLSLRYRSRLIHVAHFMGKYALVDVFLVIIIIGFGRIKVSVPSNHYTRIHIDAHYSPDMGFFFFSFSNCLSLVMSDTVMRYHQQTSYEVVQRTISLHNKIPFKDIVAYNLMLRLAKSPSAGLESPLPILPACLPHPFSLSEFYQQSALTQRKRLVKEDSALCWHGHIYRWMRMRWLDLLVKERYILPFFLCGTLIFLYVAFLFDAVVVTYGGLFGYLMNTSGQQKGDAFYITTDQRFSISKFGSDFANASVFDGQPDAHAYIVQILFFLTTLIIPTVIIIGCLILWYFPLPIQCWPTINAYMLSFRTYSTFHILVLTIILEQFSIARFGGYMLGKYCASITPLLDAMYGHLFEGSCASIAANECVWMMLLGTCAMVDILGVCLVARRIEHLSELVSATVQDPFLAPVSCTLEEPDLSQSGESKREINP